MRTDSRNCEMPSPNKKKIGYGVSYIRRMKKTIVLLDIGYVECKKQNRGLIVGYFREIKMEIKKRCDYGVYRIIRRMEKIIVL